MASKRTYPEQTCENPQCKTPFRPRDKRQRFCTPQCNDNYNNDKRSLEQKNIKVWIQRRKQIDDTLEGLYPDREYNPLESFYLEVFDIEFNLAKREKSLKNKSETYWFERFGLRPLDNNLYQIISRNEL